MKESVIGPNTGLDLFVNLNNIGAFFTGLKPLRGLMKFSVLCEGTTRLPFWLVESLWIRYPSAFWLVVTFVNKDRTIVLNFVAIGRVWTDRHKDDRVAPFQSEIHTALEARAFFLAHLNVGNNITPHGSTPTKT